MNAEELKMILEALGRLGETAGTAAQWWLVLHYGERFLSVVAVAGSMLAGVSVVAIAISRNMGWGAFGRRVAVRFGGRGEWSSMESDEQGFERHMAVLLKEVSKNE